MRLQELSKSLLDMPYVDGIAVVEERRRSRFVSKRAQRPRHVNRKIDKKNEIIDLLQQLTPEERAKFLEEFS